MALEELDNGDPRLWQDSTAATMRRQRRADESGRGGRAGALRVRNRGEGLGRFRAGY